LAQWTSVASSADGTKIVAGEMSGYLYTSTDSGLTWHVRGNTGQWVSIASSVDGTLWDCRDPGIA
jgi:hypothetical protein